MLALLFAWKHQPSSEMNIVQCSLETLNTFNAIVPIPCSLQFHLLQNKENGWSFFIFVC